MESYKSLIESATNGDVNSQYQLGLFYLKKNKDESRIWLEKASLKGHKGARLQLSFWDNNLQIGQDLAEEGYTDAMFELGRYYQNLYFKQQQTYTKAHLGRAS